MPRASPRTISTTPPIAGDALECYFINVWNASPERDVTVTHVWLETQPQVQVMTKPLPARIAPHARWETFVPVENVGGSLPDAEPASAGTATPGARGREPPSAAGAGGRSNPRAARARSRRRVLLDPAHTRDSAQADDEEYEREDERNDESDPAAH
jgi:hypothetical protein